MLRPLVLPTLLIDQSCALLFHSNPCKTKHAIFGCYIIWYFTTVFFIIAVYLQQNMFKGHLLEVPNFDLLKILGKKSKHILTNGGLMVIYHGKILKTNHLKKQIQVFIKVMDSTVKSVSVQLIMSLIFPNKISTLEVQDQTKNGL